MAKKRNGESAVALAEPPRSAADLVDSVLAKAEAEREEKAAWETQNRAHGMKRYCEILVHPETDPDGACLHDLMTELGITAEAVKADVEMIERLRKLRGDVAAEQGTDEKIAEARSKLKAAHQAVEEARQEVDRLHSRRRVAGMARVEIESVARRRHELFEPELFVVSQGPPEELVRATRDGTTRERITPPPRYDVKPGTPVEQIRLLAE